MGSVKQFAAINTKVHVLEGMLLKNQDYIKLLEASGVSEMLKYLRDNTSYFSLLENIDIKESQKINIGELFKEDLIKKYTKLIPYFNDEYRKFFKLMLMRYEIEHLKILIRMIIREEDISQFNGHSKIPIKYRLVNYDDLKESRNINDFVEKLRGSPYYKELHYYLDEPKDKILFFMEINLDRIYFKLINKLAEQFTGEDKEILLEVLGKNSDVLNIQLIYRGKKYYELSHEELINYTLPYGSELKYKQLKELCYNDISGYIEEIKKTKYRFLFEGEEGFETFLEINMEKYIFKLAKKLKKENRMNIAEALAYIHIKEFEMRDLFTLIETKKYGMSPQDAKKYLVREI
jgi:V/A-type H+-transporting ATPase subunit C